VADTAEITRVVEGLDHWLESMRVAWPSPGYGGPVVHWWNHSLAYRGAGFDWRYEGIIAGYLHLWEKTGNDAWLAKARRVGNDLVAAQSPDGHFPNSQFELNPGTGGTPHEAAADLGLLILSRTIRTLDPAGSSRYLETARGNLEQFWFDQLWHDPSRTLWDSPGSPGFVPNKAATFIEAVLVMSELDRDHDLVDRYVIPTADLIVSMQVVQPGDRLDGAIAQYRLGTQQVDSYFPLYIARCVPALFAVAELTGSTRYRDAALRACRFIDRVREPDGGSPQVLYPRNRMNRFPSWIAGAGDIVRAIDLARQNGETIDAGPTIDWIVRGARSDGRIATAEGFGRIMPLLSRRDRFADELGVVGWADKALRALSSRAESPVPGTMDGPGMSCNLKEYDNRVIR
jgi:hypothetical protein